jgi:hypothetical protein
LLKEIMKKLAENSQHGFTRGRSCLANLLEFLEGITYKLDKGEQVDVIYLDFYLLYAQIILRNSQLTPDQ